MQQGCDRVLSQNVIANLRLHQPKLLGYVLLKTGKKRKELYVIPHQLISPAMTTLNVITLLTPYITFSV